MVGIILLILKIIGIILLSIIALALLIILILLFAPAKYYFIGNKKEDFYIDTKFTWLFSIISVKYIYKDGSEDFKIRIPFKDKFFSDENEAPEKSKKDKKEKRQKLQEDMPVSVHHISNTEPVKIDEPNSEENNKPNSKENKPKINFELKKIKEKFKGIKKNIADTISFIKKNKAEVIKFNKEFGIKKVVKITLIYSIKILKALRLKKFSISGKIGLDNPADTGFVIGAVSMIIPFIPGDINIDGDFNNKVLEGSIFIKGKTNLLLVLIPVVKYILTEPIWSVIKKYWR